MENKNENDKINKINNINDNEVLIYGEPDCDVATIEGMLD